MYQTTITTNDQTRIAIQSSLPIKSQVPHTTSSSEPNQNHELLHDTTQSTPIPATCILLMHGFSGSSAYFTRNFETLSSQSWVVAPDLRGHGSSQHTKGGYHIARLAADLKSIITYIHNARPGIRVYGVGCSISAAILWTYIELFGNHFTDPDHHANQPKGGKAFTGMIFVDQAPLQDRSVFNDWNESKAHRGLYDEDTLLAAQAAWASDDKNQVKEAHKSLVESCLGYRAYPDPSDAVSLQQQQQDEEFFTEISARCNGKWLARLMSDHTRYDHREAIEDIDVPVLVMIGDKSGCFPVDGMLETVRRVNKSKTKELAKASIFDCGHWLFYEDPVRFNREVLEFVSDCESQYRS